MSSLGRSGACYVVDTLKHVCIENMIKDPKKEEGEEAMELFRAAKHVATKQLTNCRQQQQRCNEFTPRHDNIKLNFSLL